MSVSTGTSGIQTQYLAATVRPQDDLYRHVNGTWLDSAEIPQDRAVYGAFHRLHEEAEKRVRAIIEEAVAAGDAAPGPGSSDGELGKVGDLYSSFMDEEAVEALGIAPIAADLAEVAAIEDRGQLLAALGRLGRAGLTGAFGFWVDTDAKASDSYIVYLSQAGLGLPDESYYREESFAEIRTGYVAHVERLLGLAGVDEPATAAQAVMALETRLAGAHWDRVANRDATRTYTRLDAADLAALAPGIDWELWREGLGAPASAFAQVVVRQPSYLTALGAALSDLPLDSWKAWLTWRVVHGAAPFLPAAFVAENFAFYGTTLTGTPQLRERWKRGVSLVEGALGEAVAKVFVARHFPPNAKARMVELVANLTAAYRRQISALDWMGDQTKARALDKLDRFTPKIGYPDRWRDYSALTLQRHDLLGNVRRAAAFELARDLAKLGGPVDRTEWFMTPQTVNAYYNPGMNEIVFPAAILQPPFFDAGADDAANYGGIGAVIGHEIGHGFDDQGSKYDGVGNLVDWWTPQDRERFEERTAALIAQYEVLEPAQVPGNHVNGALTVGENIGDLGGLSIAYTAYQIALDGTEPDVLDGLTGAQRFFYGWAQVWRTKARDTEVIRRLAIDPHSPEEFRCNAVVRNIDAFHETFGVRDGDGLWLEPAARVRIW